MLSGVSGGVAEYLGVDSNIVRIAFVVLSLFGGVGVVLYGSGWLLMPDEGESTAAVRLMGGSRRNQLLTVVGAVVVGIIVLNLISDGPWWGNDTWHAGSGIAWLIFAVVAGYLVIRLLSSPRFFRRLFIGLLISFVSLVGLLLLGTLGAELATGVPLSGGIGSQQWHPTTISQVDGTYRTGVGNATLDLADVSFPDRVVHVTASVGIGRLLVEVPPGLEVSITAHSGIGNVVYNNLGPGPFSGTVSVSPHGKTITTSDSSGLLVLDAQAGIGQVDLVRAA
jgi:phage shock protein PspC (stress-responsive transcriptional regulator)